MSGQTQGEPVAIAARFATEGRFLDVRPYGHGIINDTFLVLLAAPDRRFILQRINRNVFPHPDLIMENMRRITEHVAAQTAGAPASRNNLELPAIIPTSDDADYVIDETGDVWRAISFIEGTRSLERLNDAAGANEVGRALGRFHGLLSGMDPASLHDTLPGFHVTPRYLTHFDEVAAHGSRARDDDQLREALDFVAANRARAGILEEARQAGLLPLRIIHGDPKLNNFLFDPATGRAVSIIDLDTVKPGLVHYDIGDCLRSCCNTVGESPPEGGAVQFDLEICNAILAGYYAEARGFLGNREHGFVYDAVWLISFELGLRFLTDHLEGDRYFKVETPGHNLRRALTQFGLASDIRRKESAIRQIVARLI